MNSPQPDSHWPHVVAECSRALSVEGRKQLGCFAIEGFRLLERALATSTPLPQFFPNSKPSSLDVFQGSVFALSFLVFFVVVLYSSEKNDDAGFFFVCCVNGATARSDGRGEKREKNE